ncbi:Panacea domain-containing protein [Agrobacterium cavarae]|uniref:Panacea domain-containing protein n=1 Tax=Agrobacterium cavarae TaxID=2528239 RepID=UPI00289BDD9A|nr:Panacea domain-containing protein [Agrobacterium cavarae]
MRFSVDKEKTIEALLYIVTRYGEAGRFHALKTLYFADREHLRLYGRPITGDRYIAMDNGPVPSYAYNALKQEIPEPERHLVSDALSLGSSASHPTYVPHREPDLSFFSKTDLECLEQAYAYCSGKSFGAISDETHKHLAWRKAPLNGEMRVKDMLDGVPEDIAQEAELFASYGVL